MLKYVYKTLSKKIFIFFLDIIGCLFLFPFIKVFTPIFKTANSILIIRLDQIGDLIKSIYILEILKKIFNKAQIIFLTTHEGKELFEGNPWIDKILVFSAEWFRKNKGVRVERLSNWAI
jgi:hypothetical protein